MSLGKIGKFLLGIAAGALLLAGLSMCLWGAPTARAAAVNTTLFVKPDGVGSDCTRTNPCALDTALSRAEHGNTIALSQGVYTGTGDAVINITKQLALYGGWDGAPTGPMVSNPKIYQTIIDGEGLRRGIAISGTHVILLDGLIISNGNATGLGGWISSGGEIDAGGGIYVNGASVIINDSVISNNTAGDDGTGGGIVLIRSDSVVQNSIIQNNSAKWGGGVRAIEGNPNFRASQFISNTARFGGGLYLMWTGSETLVEGNEFWGNGYSNGGAIYLSGSMAIINDNNIHHNRGSTGGGVSIASGPSVIVTGNSIWENQAGRGGGLHVSWNAARVMNNMIVENHATRNGAGVYINSAKPLFVHNTLARNTGGDGAGMYLANGAAAWFTNTILVSHTVGISVTAGSTATLEGVLWGGGPWANGTDWGGDGAIFTGTVNIWGDPAFRDPSGKDYHIGPGSAAIDAGVDAGLPIDIDRDPRPTGAAPDIGADEFPQWLIRLPLVVKDD